MPPRYVEYSTPIVGVALILGFWMLGTIPRSRADQILRYEIKPSTADPRIDHFDEANLVAFEEGSPNDVQLVVFMPGTGGTPKHTARLMGIIALQGYRVIDLEYNNSPAVVQVCPDNPRSACSAEFRQERVFGGGDTRSVIETPQPETIISRLVTLLQYLQRKDASRQWDGYLEDGEPNWSRIVIAGVSQGAGMAAYIAKEKSVARVVLFSSPWDYQRPEKLAPWLSSPSVTPPERWFAEFHRRENTAALIARAYQALRIPSDNVLVFDRDLPPGLRAAGDNPYHYSTVQLDKYAAEWQFLFSNPVGQ